MHVITFQSKSEKYSKHQTCSMYGKYYEIQQTLATSGVVSMVCRVRSSVARHICLKLKTPELAFLLAINFSIMLSGSFSFVCNNTTNKITKNIYTKEAKHKLITKN